MPSGSDRASRASSLLDRARAYQKSATGGSGSGRSRRSGVRTGKSRTTPKDEEDGGGSYDLHDDTTESDISTPKNTLSKFGRSKSDVRKDGRGREATADYELEEDDDDGSGAEEGNVRNRKLMHSDSAHFRQNVAPCSTAFCLVQCVILPVMMWQCGVAPLNINPMVGPYPDALNYWGAKNAVLIVEDGEWWRLFTPIFLHAGLIHLVGNVMVQIDAGNQWEKEWGSPIWMIIYIGSAFGSSVFSTCFMPDNISVGSSGAVMGLFGAKFSEIVLLCCEKSTNVRELSDERSRKQQASLVIGGIVIVAAMSFIPYVDWAAHLGGMIAGFVLGLVCFSFKIRNWFFMMVWLVVGVGSCIALYSAGMAYMYNEVETKDELRDVCGYYQQYFDDYECRCMLDEAIEFGSWQFGGGANNGNGNDDGGGNSNSNSNSGD